MRHFVWLLFLVVLSGCDMLSVDYGHARWICVDPSIDDAWFEAIERASEDVWRDQYGATVKPTRDCKETDHRIYPIPPEQCTRTLDSPGTYFIDIGADNSCLGVADFNETINVWHVGLVVDTLLNNPGWNFYDREYLAAHELGHVLGCGHTRPTGATIITCDGEARGFWGSEDLFSFTCDGELALEPETKPGIMHYGMGTGHTPNDMFLMDGDFEVCPRL